MLPIGGPGKALTARDQANILFEAAGVKPNFFPVSCARRQVAAGCLWRLPRCWVPAIFHL